MMKKTSLPKDPSSPVSVDRLEYFESHLDSLLKSICEFVAIESPSDSKPATDRMGTHLAQKFAELGGRPHLHRAEEYGDNLQIDFPGPSNAKPVLVLGHFDTVYPLGTLPTMPCRIDKGRLYGPGVLDMKAGVALMLFALEALQPWHREP